MKNVIKLLTKVQKDIGNILKDISKQKLDIKKSTKKNPKALTRKPRMSEKDIKQVKKMLSKGVKVADISDKMDLSRAGVYAIKNGKLHKDVN